MKLAFFRANAVESKVQAQPIARDDKRATQAAQAAIAQVQEPGKLSKTWSWTKDNFPRIAYSVALTAAAILFGTGLAAGAASALAMAGYTLGGVALLGAGIYEYKKAINIDNHAKELYEAVKAFDDLNPSSNKYVTAQQRYLKARWTIEKDLMKLNPSDKEAFVQRIARASSKDINFRINSEDGRYSVILENPKEATFEDFVRSIVDVKTEQVQAAYDKELDSYAKTFADALKNDILISRKIRHNVDKASYKVGNKKEYKILDKSLADISKDLLDKIKNKLGERYVRKEISKLESLMTDRYSFWSAVESLRKNVRKDYNSKFEAREKQIKDLERQLKDLDDAEAGLEKEKISLRAIVRNLDNAQEKIEEANIKIMEIDRQKEEIENHKEKLKKEIAQLQQKQAEIESKLGYEHLIDLNARRRELARLLGQEDVTDLELPGYPTFVDKFKYWAPRIAGTAAFIAGAYYGWPYAKPYVAPYLASAATAVNGAYEWTKDLFGKNIVENGPALRKVYFLKDNVPHRAMVHEDIDLDSVRFLANAPKQYWKDLQIIKA